MVQRNDPFCACGCGQQTRNKSRWIPGHWWWVREGVIPYGFRCVSYEDWRNWFEIARRANTNREQYMTLGEMFCAQCTREYEQEMRAEGRCVKDEVMRYAPHKAAV